MLDIISETAAEYGVTIQQLLGAKRTKNIAAARTVAMYRCRRDTLCSFHDIADVFNKDHSTVVHACKRMNTWYAVSSPREILQGYRKPTKIEYDATVYNKFTFLYLLSVVL